MKNAVLILLLALQLTTAVTSIFWFKRLEAQTRDAQLKQFKAEMKVIDLEHKLSKTGLIYL